MSHGAVERAALSARRSAGRSQGGRGSGHAFAFHLVLYWEDLDTAQRWLRSRESLLRVGADAVDFYYIREHELTHPPLDAVLPRIERQAALAAELRERGIATAAALLPALGWGQETEEGPFEKIVGPGGERSGAGSCPLGPSLRAYLLAIAERLAQAGHAAIVLEDDFQNDNHRPVRHGCFCERHLSAFSAKEGRAWTRERLAAAVEADPGLRERWDLFRMEALCDLARALRERARLVAPDIEMRVCAGGDVQRRPGALLETLESTSWRPSQGHYAESPCGPLQGPLTGWCAHLNARRTRDVRALAEITTWPRTSFAKSWRTSMLQAALSAFLGMEGAIWWGGFGPRDPDATATLASSRPWLDAISRAVNEHKDPVGVVVPAQASGVVAPGILALHRMGLALVPQIESERPNGAPLALLGAPTGIDHKNLGRGPLVVDADALRADPALAAALDLTAADAAGLFFSCERYTDEDLHGPWADWYSSSLTMLTAADRTRITSRRSLVELAHFLDNDSRAVTPSVLIDEAARLLVFNHTRAMWEKLVSPAKVRQVQAALRRVTGGPLPAAVSGPANLCVFARESAASRLVLVMNLSYDPAANWRLELDRPMAAAWQAGDDGRWVRLPPESCPVRGRPAAIAPRSAVLLRLSQDPGDQPGRNS